MPHPAGVPGSLGVLLGKCLCCLRPPGDEVSWGKGSSRVTTLWEGAARFTVPQINALTQVLTPRHGYASSPQGGSEQPKPFVILKVHDEGYEPQALPRNQVRLFLVAGNQQPDGQVRASTNAGLFTSHSQRAEHGGSRVGPAAQGRQGMGSASLGLESQALFMLSPQQHVIVAHQEKGPVNPNPGY